MKIGLARGIHKNPFKNKATFGLNLFIHEEGGYTSLTVASAILVSLCLVFGIASISWLNSRSSEVQRVADAAALAGSNAVTAYVSVAQVLDACVLSMGITGVVVSAAGLVLAAVPGLGPAGLEVGQVGTKILEARQRFAQKSAEGLSKFETTLPLLVATNSASCIAANSEESNIEYVGCALPFPVSSQTNFALDDAEIAPELLSEQTEKMSEVSDRADKEAEAANEARDAGWRADCGDKPYCLWQRAETLAGLTPSQNPWYPTTDGWNFGIPLMRARAYYAARSAAEAPQNSTAGELTNSCARKAFYDYALSQVNNGHYIEQADGTVDISLPTLPRNTSEVRKTSLYTDRRWPCTMEGGVRVLHASTDCPGATGPSSGTSSLSDIDAGSASRCATCDMDITDLGRVPAATTSIENGFVYLWKAICEASENYEAHKNELVRFEAEMKEIAEDGADEFDKAMDELAGERPELCPPGAWGCVSVVYRGESIITPNELTASFLSGSELPQGAAISAAVLAPDEATAENNVISRFFDGLSSGEGLVGLPAMICELWGTALHAYGSAYESIGSAVGDFLGLLDGVLGGSVAADLREMLTDLAGSTMFAPTDLRMRKPVLTNSQNVFDKAGLSGLGEARRLIERLPSSGSPAELAAALGVEVRNELGTGAFVVAELPIPGTNISIPLSIDIGSLVGAS